MAQSSLEVGIATATDREQELPARAPAGGWAGRALAPGARVGRYQIREPLASGGMGTVYRAHDTQLSRDVALKVLHEQRRNRQNALEYAQRLLREAQALAKLSHPNVVAAYEVGEHAELLFVAMELVPGESLQNWLRSGRRGRAESLRALVAAGRGLEAAHAAGVMHRDFKPSNVMVSPDARVRVIDFGIARAAGVEVRRAGQLEAAEVSPGSSFSELTQLGTVLGTPGYVAPERFREEGRDDARSDQFSFAVTAFIVLTGTKPYPGTTMASYAEALALGRRTRWPASVPRRLRAIVDRGLALQPEQRYPDIGALVDALESASAAWRLPSLRTFAWGALSLLPLIPLALASSRHPRASCEGDAEPFRSIWDGERRTALEHAFLASASPNAPAAFAQFAKRLDGFTSDWREQKRTACEATFVRGEQSEKMLALREACLDRKRHGLEALVSAFTVADPAVVDRAAGAMPEALGECADVAALLSHAERMPRDPALAAAVGNIEAELAVARAWLSAGRSTDASDRARRNLEAAMRTAHRPTIAEALAWRARISYASARGSAELEAAAAALHEAIRTAAEVEDDRLLAASSSQLFLLLSYSERRVQEAEAMLPTVEALIIRAGNDPRQRLELALGTAVILEERHDFRAAVARFEEVIELSRTLDVDPSYRAQAEHELSVISSELHGGRPRPGGSDDDGSR